MSSAAALGVAASGFGSEVAQSIGFGAPRPFSIGFSDGTRMIHAEDVRHDFRGEVARVTVRGFWSGDDAPRSTAIAAYFRNDGTDAPFLAWGHVHRASLLAPRASFRVPVHNGAITMGFESRDPLPVPRTELARRLFEIRTQVTGDQRDALIVAANNRDAAPRRALSARCGTYVVAFDAKPNWRAMQLGSGEKPLGNAPFDYLVFTIDHV